MREPAAQGGHRDPAQLSAHEYFSHASTDPSWNDPGPSAGVSPT